MGGHAAGSRDRATRPTGLSRGRAVHVFSVGADEARWHQLFRRWLLEHDDDRRAHAELKQSLSRGGFRTGGDYDGGKSALIYDINERAFAADSGHIHDPQTALN